MRRSMSFAPIASDRRSSSALISESVEAIAASVVGSATRLPHASVAAAPTKIISRRERSRVMACAPSRRFATARGGALAPRSCSVPFFAADARVRLIARFVTRVLRHLRAVATREAHQEVLLEDELLTRVVRGGVDAGVHADRVT